jgi:glutathione S-transferase
MNKTAIKLRYLNLNARGATARAILYYKKVPFEDLRISSDEWAKLKKTGQFEFDQLPQLEINGKTYHQSIAINQLLGKKYDLFGRDQEEDYLTTSAMCAYEDIRKGYFDCMFPKNEEHKKEADKAFCEIHGPYFLKRFEKRFLTQGGKYFASDRFSLGDIFVTCYFHNIFKLKPRKEQFEPVYKEFAPKLYEHCEKISDNELKEYFEKHYIHNAEQ